MPPITVPKLPNTPRTRPKIIGRHSDRKPIYQWAHWNFFPVSVAIGYPFGHHRTPSDGPISPITSHGHSDHFPITLTLFPVLRSLPDTVWPSSATLPDNSPITFRSVAGHLPIVPALFPDFRSPSDTVWPLRSLSETTFRSLPSSV